MNDTAFWIGDVAIKWYAIIIVSGMLIALGLFMFLCSKRSIIVDKTNMLEKRRSLDNEFCLAMFIFAIVFAIIGARLFYAIPHKVPFFDFRNGGLTIIGGIPCGALGVYISCLIYKKSFFRVTDLVVPCLLLGQIIGRWGNFINGELYGMEITAEWLQFFPMAVLIDGTWHAANFFYEMMLNLVGMCIALFLIYRYKERIKPGVLATGYLAWYALVRGSLEFLKVDPHRWGNVKAVQCICFIVLPIAIIILVLLQRGVISLETQAMYRKHFKIPLEPPELVLDGDGVIAESSDMNHIEYHNSIDFQVVNDDIDTQESIADKECHEQETTADVPDSDKDIKI